MYDLNAVRQRLAKVRGPEYWRCLEELADSAEFKELVSREAPRLTARGPVPYDAFDGERPLEAGMMVSVETTVLHPRRGFIKLEDTVVVTDTGHEVYGEGARGWNRAGAR